MAGRGSGNKKEEGSWMDTYGDMVTLLLTFFIMLFAMSSLSEVKFEQFLTSFGNQSIKVQVNVFDESEIINIRSLSDEDTMGKIAIQSAASSTVQDGRKQTTGEMDDDGGEGKEMELGMRQAIDTVVAELENTREFQAVEMEFDYLYNRLRIFVDNEGLTDVLKIERLDSIISIRMTDSLLYESGRVDLTEQSKIILEKLGLFFKESLSSIELITIEGHTDNVPIHNSRFEDNWDLSAKRATNVVRVLNRSGGIPMNTLNAVAYGEQMPIATNDTAEGRSLNRRVCFVINRKDVLADLMQQSEN